MIGLVFFLFGIIAVIAGAFFIDGWVSWLVVIVGLCLQGLGKVLSEDNSKAGVGLTDETILRLLFYASLTDGNNSEEENKYMREYVKRRRLSEKQVKAIIEESMANKASMFIPNDEDEKIRIIDEVVGVLKADGVVTDDEREFLGEVADIIKIDKQKAFERLNRDK